MNYEELELHHKHNIRIAMRFDKTAVIECIDCDTDVYVVDENNNEVTLGSK